MSDSRAFPSEPAPSKPVFLDPSRKRWNGFLVFAGSMIATVLFLGVILGVSVSTSPEIQLVPNTQVEIQQVALGDFNPKLSASRADFADVFGPPTAPQIAAPVLDVPALDNLATTVDVLPISVDPAPRAAVLSQRSNDFSTQDFDDFPSIQLLDEPDTSNSFVFLSGTLERRVPDFFPAARVGLN